MSNDANVVGKEKNALCYSRNCAKRFVTYVSCALQRIYTARHQERLEISAFGHSDLSSNSLININRFFMPLPSENLFFFLKEN